MQHIDIAARVSTIFILSLLFGIERQLSNKAVGFGTYIFVAVGSCGLAMAAVSTNPENPLPLLSGIITGIGFLGAGALMKTADKIYGFTTAASIWIFAILGVLIGTGYYFMGALAYAVVWIVVVVDKYLEHRGLGSYRRRVVIKTNKIIQEKEIRQLIKPLYRNRLISMNVDKVKKAMMITYMIETQKRGVGDIINVLNNIEWVDSCNIE